MPFYVTVSKQIIIYFGLFTCLAGVIGGILNIIVFLSLRIFREKSCAFYLTIMSFVNIGELITGYLTRIMINGFDIDWTQTSIFYCKFRWFYVQLCLLTTFTCLCLATIDQYCSTCSNPRWQQYSNIKLAHRLCLIFVFIWSIHGIPYLIYENHSIIPKTNITMCVITNSIFQEYFIYIHTFILTSFLPVIITVIFGILAYRNLQQINFQTIPIVRRELNKQLTIMVLIQVIFNFFSIVPYVIIVILSYQANVSYTSQITTNLSFAFTITLCLYHLYFSSPFYIYICVSERFRRQLKHVLFGIYFTQWRQRITVVNEVAPAR